jgi:hypothetical protein
MHNAIEKSIRRAHNAASLRKANLRLKVVLWIYTVTVGQRNMRLR